MLNEDTMTIKREAHTIDEATGINTVEEIIINENIQCGLSLKNNFSVEDKKLVSVPVIFADFRVNIEASDILDVTTANGQYFKLVAGKPLYYNNSHVQVTCKYYEDEDNG